MASWQDQHQEEDLQIHKSIELDGIDEHVKGSTTFSELDGTDKFTLSMWIKPTNLSNL
jgi:hypothetical protein